MELLRIPTEESDALFDTIVSIPDVAIGKLDGSIVISGPDWGNPGEGDEQVVVIHGSDLDRFIEAVIKAKKILTNQT